MESNMGKHARNRRKHNRGDYGVVLMDLPHCAKLHRGDIVRYDGLHYAAISSSHPAAFKALWFLDTKTVSRIDPTSLTPLEKLIYNIRD